MALGRQHLHALQQPVALGLVSDALCNSDVGVMRQIDQHPPGNADLRGEPGALAADGILDDLHQQRLPWVQELLDGGGLVPIHPALPQVRHMQEGRAFQPDVDEGRLHARQHAIDDAGVDVAHLAPTGLPVKVEFLQNPLLDECHPGLW